ncbi:MAG: alginate lyase family protein [Longimicrobiaceae bacterium]
MTSSRSTIREMARLAASVAYRVGVVAHPRRLLRRRPPATPAAVRVLPAAPVPPGYDADTQRWVAGVLAGSFRSPFADADPEGMHDALRLRGVLPALAGMCSRVDAAPVLARIGELVRHTAALADRHPLAGWDTSTAALRMVSILDAVEELERRGISLLREQPWMLGFVAAHRRALRAGAVCEPAGNHWFVNAAGRSAYRLLLSGRDPLPGRAADGLAAALGRQFLPDGGHVEMAPHYHVQVLALAGRLLAADTARGGGLRASLAPGIHGPREALGAMLAPDGSVARFGDASRSFSGCTVERDVELALGTQPGRAPAPCTRLPDFGMSCWRWGSPERDFCLFVDVGALGMGGNPGHGHADMLSFTLYVGRVEVIADPGTYLYSDRADAMRFKRHDAHNTVCWTGRPVADLARFFRWRSAAAVPAARLLPSRAAAGLAALRYADGRSHRRSWSLLPDGLMVVDELRGGPGPRGPATTRLMLHPDSSVTGLGPRGAVVRSPAGTLAIELQGAPAGECRVDEGEYAPAYGVRTSAPVLAWPVAVGGGESSVRTRIRLLG